MLIARQTLFEIDRSLRGGSDPSGRRFASVETDLDPLDLVRAGAEAFGWAGFYSSPDGRSVGALGAAATYLSGGAGRLERLDAQLDDVMAGVPLLVGFSFDEHGPSSIEWDGFPSATAVLPEVSVERVAGRSQLTVVVRPGSDGRLLLGLLSALRPPPPVSVGREVDHTVESRPTPDDWRDLVSDAVAMIRSGTLAKVVLARSVSVRTPRPLHPFGLVAELRDRFPECRVFGWQHGEATFIGASPELLVTREGEYFRLNPLAGSAPRGADPDQDRRLGDALLASSKDRLEHSIVVDDALRRLAPIVTGVTRPAEPVLQRFATVQHLATPVAGRTSRRVLELAHVLHPTAAVGGEPRREALAFIAKQEGLDRGWYSGGIGWTDSGGDGEIALALRCALVRGGHAMAFAGNGIVEASEPDEELAETRLKLRPMLDLLTGP